MTNLIFFSKYRLLITFKDFYAENKKGSVVSEPFLIINKLKLTNRNALEGGDGEATIYFVQYLGNGFATVFYKVLVQQGVVFVEFV